jgi:TolB-like protein
LRRALQDDSGDPKYIETVPKRGYRLIGQIRLPDATRLEKNQAHSVFITQLYEHKMAFGTVTVLAFALAYFAYNEFVIRQVQEEAPATTSTQFEGKTENDRSKISVAVLPFVNMSDDPGNDYFSDGLSEEIINLLAKVPGLKVIGRTSSFAFKGTNEDLRVIGRALGVKTVLEGSVRKSGDRVRIAAQLIDVSDGTHLWSETYDRTMTDIFAVQNDVAAAIIDALQIHVGANPTRGHPTENTDAYALFLKARASINTSKWLDAEELLLKAIELDPKFAEAFELLAATYWGQAGDTINAAEGQMLMFEAAAKALAIDPDLVLAQAYYRSGNLETMSALGGIEAFERVILEQPSSPEPLNVLAIDLLVVGYLQESLGFAKRYVELDPLSPAANSRLAEALYAVGRTSEAIAALEVFDRVDADGGKWVLGEMKLVEKQDDIAIAYFEADLQRSGNHDSSWVKELVTGARDPATGQAYLDRRIPQIVASAPEEYALSWQLSLTKWYLFFGFLDRYFELILATDITNVAWTDSESLIRTGTMYRRLGFTAHPKYLEVTEALKYIELWEQRGQPDFCEKVSGEWVCD